MTIVQLQQQRRMDACTPNTHDTQIEALSRTQLLVQLLNLLDAKQRMYGQIKSSI